MPSPLHGQLTGTGSLQQLTADTTDTAAFTIKASKSNAQVVAIGGSGLTSSNGHFLDPGEQITYERINQTGLPRYTLRQSDFYVIAASGDKVSWLATAS